MSLLFGFFIEILHLQHFFNEANLRDLVFKLIKLHLDTNAFACKLGRKPRKQIVFNAIYRSSPLRGGLAFIFCFQKVCIPAFRDGQAGMEDESISEATHVLISKACLGH